MVQGRVNTYTGDCHGRVPAPLFISGADTPLCLLSVHEQKVGRRRRVGIRDDFQFCGASAAKSAASRFLLPPPRGARRGPLFSFAFEGAPSGGHTFLLRQKSMEKKGASRALMKRARGTRPSQATFYGFTRIFTYPGRLRLQYSAFLGGPARPAAWGEEKSEHGWRKLACGFSPIVGRISTKSRRRSGVY